MSAPASVAAGLPGRYELPELIALLEGDRIRTAVWLREVARTLGRCRLPIVIHVLLTGFYWKPRPLAIH